MKKQLAYSVDVFKDVCFDEQEKIMVQTIAKKIETIMNQCNVEKLINVGNSFSWVSDYLKTSKNMDVTLFAYSSSTLTFDKVSSSNIDKIFQLPLYRKHINADSIKILHEMFIQFGLTLNSLLTKKRLYLDMTKTGKGIRSFLHELELFVQKSDPDNFTYNLTKFKLNNLILVFQPKAYGSNNIYESLFRGYDLIYLNTNHVNEQFLEEFCDNDTVRLVPSNPIDKNFKFIFDIHFTKESIQKHNFFNR